MKPDITHILALEAKDARIKELEEVLYESDDALNDSWSNGYSAASGCANAISRNGVSEWKAKRDNLLTKRPTP